MSLSERLVVHRATVATRKNARERRQRLERELADYCSSADRQDLEAVLDRYPDDVTYEIRDILAAQGIAQEIDRSQRRWPAIHGKRRSGYSSMG